MITVVHGDITESDADAIVNAANSSLLGGGGVDGAIHRAAGPELLEDCRRIPEKRPGVRCEVGEAVITGAGRLRARYVIHTVGPVYGTQDSARKLGEAYRNSLRTARQYHCRSVAIPAISTGAYGYPMDEASEIAESVCEEFPELDIRLHFV